MDRMDEDLTQYHMDNQQSMMMGGGGMGAGMGGPGGAGGAGMPSSNSPSYITMMPPDPLGEYE
jgi:ribosomal protein L15